MNQYIDLYEYTLSYVSTGTSLERAILFVFGLSGRDFGYGKHRFFKRNC